MLKSGNGTPQQCAGNLLKTQRFSVPYERIKGINGAMVDRPAASAGEEMAADAEWMLETYEPRISINGIKVNGYGNESNFTLDADISVKIEEDTM